MKQLLIYIFLLFGAFSFSQDNSRGSKSSKNKIVDSGTIRALVVGISDYKEDKLKLNYADNDAALFKYYLSEVEGIPDENISLLINEKATSINIVREFKNLINKTESGDTVYIYFAGHGDVVDDFGDKEGFLLASDANANQEYYAGGVIPLALLNNKVVNNLAEKGANVILILDACHSGFVFEEGTQKNLGTMQAMFENSTKFLSCGPNELSYESSDLQHGYFTHSLVKALAGNADTNSDNNLQYEEIDDYLYENVFNTVSEKHKQNQTPVVRTQNKRAILKSVKSKDREIVFESLKSAIESTKALAARGLLDTDEKDPNIRSIIKRFNDARARESYYGKSSSAYEIYKSAKIKTTLSESYLQKMQSILIEDLSSSAQSLINKYIDGTEILPKSSAFYKQAKHLEICLELMEDDAFLRDRIVVSKLLLESYVTIRSKNTARYKTVKKKLKEALRLEPRAAYIHNALGIVYNHEKVYDSAHYHFNQAKKLINTWSNPVTNLGDNFLDQYQYDDAKTYYDTSSGMIGNATNGYIKLGVINENQGKFQLSETFYKKAIANEPNNAIALQKMSHLQKLRGNSIASKDWYNRAIKADSIGTITEYGLLNYILDNSIDNKTAEQLFLNAIDESPDDSSVYTEYADYLRLKKAKLTRLKLAESLYETAINNDPFNVDAYAGKGWLYLKLRRKEKAKLSFKESIARNTNKAKPYYLYANFLKDGIKDLKTAETYYLSAVEKDANYIPAYNSLIELYNKKGQQDKSIVLLNTQIGKSPDIPGFWNLLGQTHFSKANYNEAISAYKKAVKLDEAYTELYSNLVYSEIENNDLESAKSHYTFANKLNPDTNKQKQVTDFILTSAKNKMSFGKPEDSKALYKLAFEINPNMETGVAYAEYLYLTSDPENAIVIGESLADKIQTKGDKIDILKLLVKATIDTNDAKKCDAYFSGLMQLKTRQQDFLLAAVYANYKGDKGTFNALIGKVNPQLIKSNKLKNQYSKETISKYILNL
jgi:tetratricopeptide (TPR) repeat protein